MNILRKKAGILRGCTILAFFVFIAILVSVYKKQPAYLFLFGGIGFFSGITEYAIATSQKNRQTIRKINLLAIATLLVSLAFIIGINFQYGQVFVDIYSGVITGALIQFVIARLFLPLIFGNIFCSRVCWDGAMFEILDKNKSSQQQLPSRSLLSFLFLVLITTAACAAIVFHNFSSSNPNTSRFNFFIANVIIVITGIILSNFLGPRAYCRKICPFLTISGILAPFSFFKVSPFNHYECINCGKCSKACPMHINVMEFVQNNKRINHPDCIMCENCVSACPKNCLIVLPATMKNKKIT